jgi:tetratricopeptide (TPR) repeat protein
MVIDARHDHSLRVPRPDLGVSLGTPDACTMCHADRKAAWAAEQMDRWYGAGWRLRPSDGPTLAAGAKSPSASIRELLELARNVARPAIARATAVRFAQAGLREQDREDVVALLADADPGVRAQAAQLATRFGPVDRAALLAGLLDHPVLLVRLEAALGLVEVPDALLPPEKRAARTRAIADHIASLQLDADQPHGNVSLGNFLLRTGDSGGAEAAFERAIRIDARSAVAHVNLADLLRGRGDESGARRALERGLAALPRSADLHHALGLWLVREGDRSGALAELRLATDLAPDSARYAYVHAIGLQSLGRRGEALKALIAADARHPLDPDILSALVSMHRDAADAPAALRYAKKLSVALPGNAAVDRLIQELTGKRPLPATR